MRIYATPHVHYAGICYDYYAEHVFRLSHEAIVKTFSDNFASVSTGFKNLSNQVETSLTTPKIEPANIPAIPVAPSIALSTLNVPNPPTILPSNLVLTHSPLPQLSKSDFPGVKFWSVRQYNDRRKAGKKGADNDSDSSILSCYGEDEDGNDVPTEYMNNARATAKNFFRLLLENSRAPSVWRDATIDVVDELYYILETNYPFLRLCQGHWKAKKIATNSYSQWYPGAVKRLMASLAKKAELEKAMARGTVNAKDAEVIDVDTDDDNTTSKRRQGREDDTPRPSKRPRTEEDQPAPPSRPRPTKSKAPPQSRVCKSVCIVFITF
jgi:hypothetical protein